MLKALTESAYFGAFISLFFYEIGLWIKKRGKKAFLNPLLIAIVLTIAALLILKIPYDNYASGAKILSYLLTPATVCLAIPLYEQFELLRQNTWAILLGILAGVLTSLCMIVLFSILFRFGHEFYVTLLPKSITTAIGIGVSEKLGGNVSITAATIILTGIIGNLIAPGICRIFRITDPIAKGIGIGTASHAIGTSKAMEIGEVEGAMSGLAIAVAGLLTVAFSVIFAMLY